MFRSHTCGELRLSDAGKSVTLAGWVQRARKMGGMTFVDLRDRYGITQLVFNEAVNAELCERANHLGREFVIQITGEVNERSNKNMNIPTGEIEIIVSVLNVLNSAVTPPFTIEDNSDGGDDIRMKFRYLDLRRNCVRKNLELRHKMTMEVRRYLDSKGFLEVETPMLVGSTPEGARDFVVPSRMNPGQFYALPQSPQTLKQLLMVSGFDRYFQIVKCFRDEDLRADRQPEFTQIDCEMSFVEQEDIISTFEGMAKHLFKELRGVELSEPFLRMTWADAMKYYGSDKPDLRFGMKFVELMDIMKGHGFSVFDDAAYIGGICAEGAASYTRKQLDQLTEFVKKPQIGAKGMVYARVEADGNVKSSVDKFYSQEVLQQMKEAFSAKPGDLILILSGPDAMKTRKQLCELRLEVGRQLGLRDKNKFACLWVVDFPMFEWSEEEGRLMAMHHPFTHPKEEDIPLLDTDPAAVRADVDAAASAAHGHAPAAAARRALGAPARLGAVRPVAGVSGRQRRAAHGRRDAAAPLRRPCRHGSAVFPPRRAALADAAGRRAVKLHKGNRQKCASAGFLPVSGKCARAPLQSGGRRGILFSLEKHLSAIRGQFSSKQSEGTS